MTDQQIIDRNKRIAEYRQISESNELIIEFMENSELILAITKIPDWNWLMPVVEKITTIKISKFNNQRIKIHIAENGNYCVITPFKNERTTLAVCYGSTAFDATYKAIVEFIKWYNKENKK